MLASEYLLRIVLLPRHATGNQLAIVLLLEWLLGIGLLIWWIPFVERLNWRSIGFERVRWRQVRCGILGSIAVTVALMFSGYIWQTIGLAPIRTLQPMLKELGFPVLLALFCTGAFLEEVLYRGYLIERLISLTGRPLVAGIVSWLSFSLVHLAFFGLGPTLDVSIIAAALVVLYLKERSVWPCVVLHGLNNAAAYLLFPLLFP